MRPSIGRVVRKPDLVEQCIDARPDIIRRPRTAEIAHRLGKDILNAHPRI